MERKATRQWWQRQVAAFERSGLSRQAWCARHRVSVHSLDAWRYRLRREAGSPSGAGRRVRSTALVPMVVGEAGPSMGWRAAAMVEVELAGGMRVRAPATTQVRWLAELVRELGRC